MSRHIDADVLIADIQERYCKPCKDRKEDYNEVRCRACWVDDAMDEVDGFADNSIDIVRCRECKYWVSDGGALIICDIHKDPTVPEHFCSYGEREGE